ncbi:MAG TPA: alpha/beta fold hydrolase [Hyphomicrobiaceae bacterium]|nr:alpha/beta fold hydrolase [Hyphomicrobiaceae bacterium]
MSPPEYLCDGPVNARATLLLAHGAGAAMSSPFMQHMAELLAERGLRVARFEFAYMAARRAGGSRRPPPRAEALVDEYHAAISGIAAPGKLIIGGKSMGGRVASMIAEAQLHADKIAGLVCLGYPFHPPKSPEKLRVAHLAALTVPTLIVQGERDPFGTRAEIAAYELSPAITFHWASDGDHDLGPRGGSGFTRKGNLAAAADAITAFALAR